MMEFSVCTFYVAVSVQYQHRSCNRKMFQCRIIGCLILFPKKFQETVEPYILLIEDQNTI